MESERVVTGKESATVAGKEGLLVHAASTSREILKLKGGSSVAPFCDGSRWGHQSLPNTSPVLAILISEASTCGAGYIMEAILATLFFRNRGAAPSYYSRFVVPQSLRAILDKREIWKCLRTTSHEEAKLKAGIWEGNISRLILLLKRTITT